MNFRLPVIEQRHIHLAELPSATRRERDPLARDDSPEAVEALFDWMIGSGRYWPHMPRIAAAQLGGSSAAKRDRGWDDALHRSTGAFLARASLRGLVECPWSGADSLSATLRALAVVLLREPGEFAQALWAELRCAEALERELMRMAAAHRLAAAATAAQLQVGPVALALAQQRIASAHGFDDWQALREAEIGRVAEARIIEQRGTLALAKAMRAQLFAGRAQGVIHTGLPLSATSSPTPPASRSDAGYHIEV